MKSEYSKEQAPCLGEFFTDPYCCDFSHIDFGAIEEKVGLHFDAHLQKSIREILAVHVTNIRGQEDTPVAEVRKAKLEEMIAACQLLESVFALDQSNTGGGEYDPLVYDIWKVVGSRVEGRFTDLHGGHVADYLASCRKQALTALSVPGKRGRRPMCQIKRTLKSLHVVFAKAGGKGVGSSRAANGNYHGPFLALVKELLDYTGDSYELSVLGNHIEKNIKMKCFIP